MDLEGGRVGGPLEKSSRSAPGRNQPWVSDYEEMLVIPNTYQTHAFFQSCTDQMCVISEGIHFRYVRENFQVVKKEFA